MPNIWTIDDDSDHKEDSTTERKVITSDSEDEIDRPSFLKRLKGLSKKVTEDDKSEQSKDKK
jgi:hypothetical protein